ncbi:MAG: PEP-CTERM sorting domain-containing protein [Planctomycetes bacterium]|nr:PEP-CTERM sorting domain-containing protein [Planctomycetota bacterium]
MCSADIVQTGTSARYIRIKNNGAADRMLHVGEIEAFLAGVIPGANLDNANDVALASKGATFESSTGGGGHGATGAVYDGALQGGAAVWTRQTVGTEYVLDLGQTRDLGTIRAWQRTDTCCNSRLSDFTVSLLSDSGLDTPDTEVFSQSFAGTAPSTRFAGIDTTGRTIQPGGSGAIGTDVVDMTAARFIRVSSPGTLDSFLHVDEIEAFAPGSTTDLALASAGATASTTKGGFTHGADGNLINGGFEGGGGTWTRTNFPAEGLVDLGQDRTIETLRVWQRADGCCQGRLANFSVALEDAQNNILYRQQHPGQAATNSFAEFSVPDHFTMGRGDVLSLEVDAGANTADRLSAGAAGGGELTIGTGAKLQVSVLAGTPTTGQRFNVIDAGQINGTFTTRDLPALSGSQFWNLSDLYSDGEIQVSENIMTAVGVEGRFIRVTNDGTANRSLHIGEIEAFLAGTTPSGGPDGGKDLALGSQGASFESQVGSGGHGGTAAVYDGALQTGGDTWTRSGVGAEYVLDLGQTRDLGTIRAWQRAGGCCQERLSDFTVSLLADNGSGAPGAEVHSESFAGNAPTSSFAAVEMPVTLHPGGEGAVGTAWRGDTEGRFIRVRNNGIGNRRLHIGEIEAFLAGDSPAGGLDAIADVALASKGAEFESRFGPLGHGSNEAVYDGAMQSGANTFSMDPGVASEYVLDLGQSRDLSTIRVWQRSDCCDDRLANFSVSLLADDGSGLPGEAVFSDSFDGQVPNKSFGSVSVRPMFTLQDYHTLAIEVDGATGTSDVLMVGIDGLGELMIEPGATLDVRSLGDWIPSGSVFDVLDFGTLDGEFGAVHLPELAPAQYWDTSNLYITGELAVGVPEPATWMLLVLGATGLACFGRRRRRAA